MKASFETSQILRWGTPGWILFVVFLFLAFVDFELGLAVPIGDIFGLGKDSLAATVIVAGAGIPIGYVLYQIYFYVRWNWPWAGSGFWMTRGRIKGIVETLEGVPFEKWPIAQDPRSQYVAYLKDFRDGKTTDFRYAWYYLETLFIELAAEDTQSEKIYERSRYLVDMFHALGTSICAIIFGGLFYLVLKLANWLTNPYQFPFGWRQVVSVIISVIILAVLFLIFQSNRDNTRNQMVSLHNYMLRKIFLRKKSTLESTDE